MSAATYLIGDVHERMAELPDGGYDLVITSPPFLALRSYLPDGHPDKAKEIGSEATPAAFLDVMLALTAEWGRLLAPHGSIAIEIGDTYSGSGGASGDYTDTGIRSGQQKFDGSAIQHRRTAVRNRDCGKDGGGEWPLAKSLAMIPELYAASLAYGRNLLTGEDSPAGRWRVRNLKPWIRSNPPVGALGDKERPATSYVTVATRATNRYFDLDAVRTAPSRPREGTTRHKVREDVTPGAKRGSDLGEFEQNNPAGAPPLDWWHEVDAIIDAEIDARAGKRANARTAKGTNQQARSGKSGDRDGNWGSLPELHETNGAVGARGVHIRRALERAGILRTVDALDVSPKGYKGAHYAVWPMELVKLLVQEMCPRRVCTTCGQPSRRITAKSNEVGGRQMLAVHIREQREAAGLGVKDVAAWFPSKSGGLTGCVSNWEAGTNVPTGEQWRVLKARLDLADEFDDLVLGDRRWTESTVEYDGETGTWESAITAGKGAHSNKRTHATRLPALNWSDCGHGTWRPGRILDPFAGSGTTLAVATGLGMDADGVDLDERNAELARERVGMFLEVDYGRSAIAG